MQKITPMLWFDGTAEEAARFHTSLFPDSRIDKVVRSAADNPSTKAGDVITVEYTVAGSPFVGLNGGPDFRFNEAVSFVDRRARTRRRSIATGTRSSRAAESTPCAAGSRTGSVFPGRSSRVS